MEKLASLGYVSGHVRPTPKAGVTIYERASAFNGFNYYTSGHAPETILMDMQGKVLHKWRYDFQRFRPGYIPTENPVRTTFWRRAHLFKNGDLLAIFEGLGLLKVNKDSKLLWGFRGNAHHAMEVTPDGRIFVLTREARMIPSINSKHPVLEDFVTILSSQGAVIKKISILKAVQSSEYAPIVLESEMQGDIFHTNTIHVLDGSVAERAPFLKKGNVMLSLCLVNTIAVLDVESEKIVWALSNGMWRKQHEPVLLANGHIVLFDNQGLGNKSRVIEFDAFTQQLIWSYEASHFYSPILGSNQRLPNGNTLITESWFGRVFEVTPDHKIVWEFRNPYRAGDHQELVAVIPDMIRIPPEFPMDWLNSK